MVNDSLRGFKLEYQEYPEHEFTTIEVHKFFPFIKRLLKVGAIGGRISRRTKKGTA